MGNAVIQGKTFDGANNELFGLILNDDFSALSGHTCRVGGIEISK